MGLLPQRNFLHDSRFFDLFLQLVWRILPSQAFITNLWTGETLIAKKLTGSMAAIAQ
ncbi:hypothetical protein [Synechocystis sp. PCC 7338]|uniref:hypothetical protein n=1 Tax=Synechocystis sp. PCC 7338 TaxID=2732530 RepID=UPI001BAE9042|nr:hypothetical protein [Synechocystis sp. PCC 7338]QUS60611.1 hypothetical protein HTZ78_07970 [Synechocystis sp. PCC 7338]